MFIVIYLELVYAFLSSDQAPAPSLQHDSSAALHVLHFWYPVLHTDPGSSPVYVHNQTHITRSAAAYIITMARPNNIM